MPLHGAVSSIHCKEVKYYLAFTNTMRSFPAVVFQIIFCLDYNGIPVLIGNDYALSELCLALEQRLLGLPDIIAYALKQLYFFLF